ncbi:response regulator transcription factor [Rathayibacter toxicus]|uniref:MerR family transcriptional regulator n=1 Tax=Rathayibacter toxicus TaxID=145458 RepID=A0A0C5BHH5_9MICO|nr:response regulator transcription factor [Rathayibacter toxicus]AJM77705.1 MerR family transcriptional regulator [Rathayibacter toxicus]ALS58132.1 two-component system response regulator [Rathayibacter toxicus]KKM45338.1 MerR family transcriptional regulator [Rathayibacter toxicus]
MPAESSQPTRVVIADDQTLIADALASLLAMDPGIDVVGVCHDGDEAWRLVVEQRPDVALLDVEMPRRSGLDVAAQIHRDQPTCTVIILTTFARPGLLTQSLAAHVSGFLVKDSEVEEVVAAIHKVRAGERVVDSALALAALTSPPNPLTDREREALRAAKDGAPLRAVADALSLAPGTVRNYLSSAIAKLGTRSRIEAAGIAQENGWL